MCARLCCVSVLVALSTVDARAQEQPAGELMQRVGDYVQRFVDAFSNVVAEERYDPAPGHQGRPRLRSDYSLVRSPSNERDFMTFRDVVEVNGKAIRDQQERLTKLFLQPSDNTLEQARAIAAHSQKYIPPTTDPLLALVFLQREYHNRFRYSLGERDPERGPDVRQIGFLETQLPTILGSINGSDLPTRGTAWVRETDGHVLSTELELGSLQTPVTVVTVFGFDKTLRIDVPIEMRESFSASDGLAKGVARYSRFRRFGVRTNETIDTPDPGR